VFVNLMGILLSIRTVTIGEQRMVVIILWWTLRTAITTVSGIYTFTCVCILPTELILWSLREVSTMELTMAEHTGRFFFLMANFGGEIMMVTK